VSIPQVMKAVEAPEPGGPEALTLVERPVPKPGVGEVLIEVAAAGVNRPDVLQRKGLYAPPPGSPAILGLEVAGTVVAAGKGPEALIGERVCALVAGGGYAEYCVAPAGTCLRVPEVLRMTEAAAMPETLFTVWVNLFERGFAADGDTVLVHGGTSGIGTMAIALGNLFGLTVIVTCGSDAKCARALEIGAAAAINYNAQDFVEEARRLTSGRGVAVLLDMVGGDYLPRNLAALAEEGRHVSIAFQRGATAELKIPDIMARRLMQESIKAFRAKTAFPSEGGAAPGFLPGIDWSDHWSFEQFDYPAIMITDTAYFRYPHYHTAQDTPDKVDFDKLARIVGGVERMIREKVASLR
jgi:NADPH:quinone reductase